MKPARPLTAALFDDLAEPIWGEGLPALGPERAVSLAPRGTTVVQPLDAIVGTNGDDTLVGTAGDDSIDGLKGADQMSGGTGNDSYVVDNAGDLVLELAGEGTDTVSASRNYTLTDHVENLILTGKAKTGTGNALDNQITGNDKANVLDGGAGADTLAGGLGNDSYTVDNAGDVLIEAAGGGTDSVKSSISYTLGAELENLSLSGSAGLSGTGNGLNNSLVGNKGANTLDGGGGNDSLDGGLGADTLIGGSGNDSYTVDNLGDVITELAGGGKDTVNASISYLLGAELDNLVLTGVANLQGTGNGLANRLTGNEGDNLLDGGAGADTLAGGLGNDSYLVDDAADVVTELAGGGTDSVSSSVSYTLAAELENLTLIGVAALAGTGNELANLLLGNSGNNTLSGAGGNDTLDGGQGTDSLLGGDGNDTYVLRNPFSGIVELANGGVDTVLYEGPATGANLAANVENLTLTGTGDYQGYGNSLDNLITGNVGNNILDGRGGIDTLVGGDGNDTYVLKDPLSAIVELANGGVDTVLFEGAATGADLAAHVENLTLTGTGNFQAYGNSLDNLITGNVGNNTLDGRGGADTLVGGVGDDLYLIDDVGDVLIEAAGGGTDTVSSSVSHLLAAEFENLTLTGAAALSGTGNALANVLLGNSGNNTLSGAGGNDTLDGGQGTDSLLGGDGDDTYVLRNPFSAIVELANGGVDTVLFEGAATGADLAAHVENLTLTGTGDFQAYGNSLDNLITGNVGNNTLDGRGGADTLVGGAGDDLYLIDDVGDVLIEAAGGGTDTVSSSVSHLLAAEFENLTLTGAAALSGTGNALANVLLGNSGNNTLSGAAGNDTLDGGLGADSLVGGANADTYVVDDAGDVVVEAGGGGNDTVQASISHVLANQVENLLLTGGAHLSGTGNGLNNSLTGNIGDNLLDGLAGNDTMAGGAGNDSYVVDAAGDQVNESAGNGTDLVIASLSYTLGAQLENLTLTGTADLLGTGNGLDNLIVGNAGNNTLVGAGGNDSFDARLGVDNVQGDGGNDTALVAKGSFDGGTGSDTASIDALDDTLGAGFGWLLNGAYVSASSSLADVAGALNLGSSYALYNNALGGQLSLSNVENLNFLSGSAGNDLAFVLGNGSVFHGGDGTDTLFADWSQQSGPVNWDGDSGEGVNSTGFERFLFRTGSGDDHLDRVDNTVYMELETGEGDDWANVSLGSFNGGGGNDTAVVEAADTTLGAGFGWLLNGIYVNATSTLDSISAAFAGGDSYQLYNNSLGVQLSLSGVENLEFMAGSAGDDLVFALGSGGTYRGGAGVDSFYADWRSSSEDIAWNGDAGHGVTTSGFERFLLLTGSGDDVLTQLSDTTAMELLTGDGADVATMNSGRMDGGAGLDTVTIDSADATAGAGYGWYLNGWFASAASSRLDIQNVINLGDQLQLHNNSLGVQLSLSGVESINIAHGSAGNDLFFAYGDGSTYAGGAGSDTFYADWRTSTNDISWNGSGGNGLSTTDFERFLLSFGSGHDTAVISSGDYDGGSGDDTANIAGLVGSSGETSYWYLNGWYADRNSARLDIANVLAIGQQYSSHAGGSGALQFSLSGFENLNLLTGADSDDLVFALGSGSSYAGGAGSDTFYADWSASTGAITWDGASGNGLSTSGFERYLLSFGSGDDSAAISHGDYEGGAGSDTAQFAGLEGSAGSTSYWYLNGWYADRNSSRQDLANVLAIGTQYSAHAGGSGTQIAVMNGFENLNVLNGADSDDLIFARGNGSLYAGGAGSDTFYADWSTSSQAITWTGSSGNGLTATGFERFLLSFGSGNDSAAISFGDYEAGEGQDTANISTLQGSSGSTSYWYLNGWYADANSSRTDLANLLAIGTQYEARAGGSGELSFALNGFETLNLLAGGHSNDLVFARGGGTVYAGGAGTDTFYADWSSATSAISWINNPAGPAQTVNGALLSGLERLLISTGSGNDLIDNSAAAVGATDDDISTGAGADTLNGGAGADQMTGGNGNDTYFVDVIGDLVFESSGAGTGTDTVRSSISYTLGDNLENLQLLGNGAIDGSGNVMANTLTGNGGNNALQGQDGNDTLAGGAGADTLTGGSGADRFQIDSLSAADLFADFSSGLDKLLVSQAAVSIGDGDNAIEGGTVVAGPGGFDASAELVIVTANIFGTITAAKAAAAIGSAFRSNYTVGQTALFAVDNGSESQLWLFTSADANSQVSAAELTLLSRLSSTASTTLSDYQFGP